MENETMIQFIDNLNTTIPKGYEKIKDIFSVSYDMPELDPVRDEICKCIICGLHQAAITLTNHLLEQSLKTCLIYNDSIDNKQPKSSLESWLDEGVKKYDKIGLSDSINYACTVGLITKEQKKLLHFSRKHFRDAYSHASLNGTFDDATVSGKMVSVEDFNSIDDLGKIVFDSNNYQDIKLNSFIACRGIAQCKFAEQDCVPYFRNIDNIIEKWY